MIRARKQGGMLKSDKGSYRRFVFREALSEGMMWELSEWSVGQSHAVFQARQGCAWALGKWQAWCVGGTERRLAWWEYSEPGRRVILDELREVGRGQALWGKECRTEAEFIYLILSLHIDFLIPVLWNLDFCILQHRIINNTAIKTFVLHNPHT